jgi:hypothetical protein
LVHVALSPVVVCESKKPAQSLGQPAWWMEAPGCYPPNRVWGIGVSGHTGVV